MPTSEANAATGALWPSKTYSTATLTSGAVLRSTSDVARLSMDDALMKVKNMNENGNATQNQRWTPC